MQRLVTDVFLPLAPHPHETPRHHQEQARDENHRERGLPARQPTRSIEGRKRDEDCSRKRDPYLDPATPASELTHQVCSSVLKKPSANPVLPGFYSGSQCSWTASAASTLGKDEKGAVTPAKTAQGRQSVRGPIPLHNAVRGLRIVC